MATNREHERSTPLDLIPTTFFPATADLIASGDPVLFGPLPAVALTDADADGKATLQFDGVWRFDVVAQDGAGNAAIAAGDTVYLDAADDELNADDTNGEPFGVALDAVDAGDTTQIRVVIGLL